METKKKSDLPVARTKILLKKLWWMIVPVIIIVVIVGALLVGKYTGWFDRIALSYVEAGDSYFERHLYGKAVQQYDFAVTLAELDGESAYEAYLHKANVYVGKNKPDRAISVLEKAIALHDNETEAYRVLGDIYFERGDISRAKDNYQSVLVIDENNALGLIGLARVQIAEGASNKEIMTTLIKAEKDGEGLLAPQYYLGLLALQFGSDTETAKEKFTKIVNNDTKNDYTYKSRQVLNRLKGIAVPTDGEGASVRAYRSLKIAWLYSDLEEYVLAAKEIGHAVSLVDDYRDAYLAGSYVLLKQNDYPKAKEYVTRAIEIDSTSGFGEYLLGKVLYKEKNLLEAETALKKALKFGFKDANVYLTLARLYRKRGQTDLTQENYLQATNQDKSGAVGLNQETIYFLIDQNEFALALEKAQALVKQNVTSARSQSLLALVYLASDEYDLAKEKAEAAQTLELTDALAEYVLGKAAKVRGNNIEAARHFDLAIDYDLEGDVTVMVNSVQ